MKTKTKETNHRAKVKQTPDENNFAELDAWARTVKLQDGRPLATVELREDRQARRVGRPATPDSAKAKRVMISMTPSLIKAAGSYAKRNRRMRSG
jgi:hypothetical protein